MAKSSAIAARIKKCGRREKNDNVLASDDDVEGEVFVAGSGGYDKEEEEEEEEAP